MKFAILGAAALAATALVTSAQAQEVITNPGRCAQFYPNANCTNLGPGNPYTDGGYYQGNQYGRYQGGWHDGYAYMRRDDGYRHHRYRHHYD